MCSIYYLLEPFGTVHDRNSLLIYNCRSSVERKAESICFPVLSWRNYATLVFSYLSEAVSKFAIQMSLIIYINKIVEVFFNSLEYLNEIQL